MAIWFTSDLHFGHKSVIEYCQRPFSSVEEMDEALINNWNKLVQPSDLVYLLGDIFFHKKQRSDEISARLAGQKILIKGNHDGFSDGRYCNTMGYLGCYREALIKLEGTFFRLSHYPCWPTNWTEESHKNLRYPEKRPILRAHEWLLCGHVHKAWKQKGQQINVGVDVWNYQPVSLLQILSIVNNDERKKVPAAEPAAARRPSKS
jgi:calcineurin-like phosphoesterase family protein